jgi:hypothetical protein
MSVDQFLLSADTTDLNYPEIRPTLDLNFARVKALDPRITFTRSSGGSYVGADGLIKYAGVNEARFDHDPETGESLGLLIEESRSNLIAYSEDFNDESWSKVRTIVTANAIAAPSGATTEDKLVEDTSNGVHFISQRASFTSGLSYTGSIFAKKGEHQWMRLGFPTAAYPELGRSASFNLDAGTLGIVQSGVTAQIVNYGNGWYRCSITATANATVTNAANGLAINPHPSNSATSLSYTGDGTSGIYVWGAQLETGAFPTSYIPTQASTRTRAADIASITGKNFSEWYRQDEGTVFVSHKALEGLKNRVASSIIYNISTGPTFLSFFYNTNSDRSDIFVFGREYGDLVRFQQNQPTRNKVIFAYDAPSSDYSPYIDGAKITNITTTKLYKPSNYDTLTLAPTPSKLNGTISRLTYFPKRLPNAQLQALTR